jgi:hypothetical protein
LGAAGALGWAGGSMNVKGKKKRLLRFPFCCLSVFRVGACLWLLLRLSALHSPDSPSGAHPALHGICQTERPGLSMYQHRKVGGVGAYLPGRCCQRLR